MENVCYPVQSLYFSIGEAEALAEQVYPLPNLQQCIRWVSEMTTVICISCIPPRSLCERGITCLAMTWLAMYTTAGVSSSKTSVVWNHIQIHWCEITFHIRKFANSFCFAQQPNPGIWGPFTRQGTKLSLDLGEKSRWHWWERNILSLLLPWKKSTFPYLGVQRRT